MGFFRKAYRFVRRIFRGRRKAKRAIPKRRKTIKRLVARPFLVKKTVQLDNIIVNANAQTTQVITGELNDIPEFAVYSQLYDQYKLMKMTVCYRVLNPINVANVTGGTYYLQTNGMVHSVIDYTDSTPPPSIQVLMNDNSYFGTKSHRDHVRTFRPKFLNLIAGNSQSQSMKSAWLHTAAPNVSHYGLKTIFEGGGGAPGTTSMIIKPILTYYFGFKDQKN